MLSRKYQRLHNRELSAGAAREIIAHLGQAREYFDAAETAGSLVKPLLQYYGVLSISRALILFRGRGLRESNLTQAHGLKADLAQGNSIADLRVTFQAGTFRELLTVTRNIEEFSASYMPMASGSLSSFGGLNLPTLINRQLPPPPPDEKCGVEDLVSRLPELKAHFEAALDRPSRCHQCSVIVWSPDTYTEISFSRLFTRLEPTEQLKAILGLPSDCEIRNTGTGGISITVKHRGLAEMHDRLPHIISSSVIEPQAGGWQLSTLASLFVCSFLMSTLVRYHPTIWMSLESGEKGDAFMPILGKLRELLQTEFPKLALKELEREKLET